MSLTGAQITFSTSMHPKARKSYSICKRIKIVRTQPVIINSASVALVPSYKYLSVTIQENLMWNEHVEAREKKANKRM